MSEFNDQIEQLFAAAPAELQAEAAAVASALEGNARFSELEGLLGPSIEPLSAPFEEVRAVLIDYFRNDREGWARGFAAWRERARQALHASHDAPHLPREEELWSALRAYFSASEEGWKNGWLAWRDLAAKTLGLPTSSQLRAAAA